MTTFSLCYLIGNVETSKRNHNVLRIWHSYPFCFSLLVRMNPEKGCGMDELPTPPNLVCPFGFSQFRTIHHHVRLGSLCAQRASQPSIRFWRGTVPLQGPGPSAPRPLGPSAPRPLGLGAFRVGQGNKTWASQLSGSEKWRFQLARAPWIKREIGLRQRGDEGSFRFHLGMFFFFFFFVLGTLWWTSSRWGFSCPPTTFQGVLHSNMSSCIFSCGVEGNLSPLAICANFRGNRSIGHS